MLGGVGALVGVGGVSLFTDGVEVSTAYSWSAGAELLEATAGLAEASAFSRVIFFFKWQIGSVQKVLRGESSP